MFRFIISSVKFLIKIVLDMLIISKFHVASIKPSANTQAIIQLCCNLSAAFVGLAYFVCCNFRQSKRSKIEAESSKPSFSALRLLLEPGLHTFAESAVRNALYLWLITTIVAIGSDYTTA